MIKKIIIAFCVMTLLVVITAALFQYQMGGEALKGKLTSLKEVGMVIRGLFFILVFGYWNGIFTWIGTTQKWSTDQINRAISSRWRIAAYIVMVEIFIIQDGFGKLIAPITGS
jgi:hypothetical protein